MQRTEANEARFWSKVNKTETCWLWMAGCRTSGYGQISDQGKSYGAHRVAWEWLRGSIPDGGLLDHICHVRTCVNPSHLRIVDKKGNGENRAGATKRSKTGVRGVCPQGNSFRAQIGHNGKRLYVGSYPTVEAAEKAVIAKRNELFTYNDLDRKSA